MSLRILFLLIGCLWGLTSLASEKEWRTPDIDNLVYLQLEQGLVIIELAPFIAPRQVKRFKDLVNEGFYNNLDFYRVIEGFVAQGGDNSGEKVSQFKTPLKAEFTRHSPKGSDFKLIQSPDFMAPETGYLHGFPAGRDPEKNEEWLLHCPGTLAFARGAEADWVTPDFYLTIGQATRHLDRNMSSLGRVIFGMPAVQSIKRASINIASGIIEDPTKRSKIQWIKLAKDVPAKDRINIQIQTQTSTAVSKRIKEARTLENDFFHFKGNGNLDVCYYQLKRRIIESTPN